MKDEKRFLSFDEAANLLNDGEQIHTFRNGGGMLIGADHSRKSLLESMKEHEATLQIGGDACRGMKHGLILEDEVGYLFIETNKEKLDLFDPPVLTS